MTSPLPVPERLPWERMDGEPVLWFTRFETYRLIGPHRRVVEAYRRSGKTRKNAKGEDTTPPPVWWQAVKRWNWKWRAEQWDLAEIERVRQEDRQNLVAMRRKAVEELERQGFQMLAFPFARQVTKVADDGTTVTTIEPTKRWTKADAVKFLEFAEKLRAKLAGEHDVSRIAFTDAEGEDVDWVGILSGKLGLGPGGAGEGDVPGEPDPA